MIWPKEAWFEPIEKFREKLGTRGEGVTVAGWDAGVAMMKDTGRKDAQGKPVFESRSDFFGGRAVGKSYVDQDRSRYDSPPDITHGSEIMRIIGASEDSCGIAPKCSIVAIKGTIEGQRYE